MSTVITKRETLADLSRVEGKAELVDGRIIRFMPTGRLPSRVSRNILLSAHLHTKAVGRGEAHGDGLGYALDRMLPSGRESFAPDVSVYDGPFPVNEMRFIVGAPNFAAEIRSESDYGPAAEDQLAAKRGDYFAAGTQIVWDVDPVNETVAVYRASSPNKPEIFRRGDTADVEPAVPGWRMAVADIFAE